MDVFGHDDVAEDLEDVVFTGLFEGLEEGVAGVGGGEAGEAVVTGEGEEVVVAEVLEAVEAERHGGSLGGWGYGGEWRERFALCAKDPP